MFSSQSSAFDKNLNNEKPQLLMKNQLKNQIKNIKVLENSKKQDIQKLKKPLKSLKKYTNEVNESQIKTKINLNKKLKLLESDKTNKKNQFKVILILITF